MKPAADRHRHYRELIPWYVNGTLDEKDTDSISQHLACCESCRREVESDLWFARRYSKNSSGESTERGAKEDGLTRLMELVDIAGIAPVPALRRPGKHVMPGLAATLVLVALGLLLLLLNPVEQPYRTLTRPSEEAWGIVLQATFHPDAQENEIRKLLHDAGATIISGPSQQGVYRLAVQTTADKEEVLAKLRDHPATRMLEEEMR